MPEEVVSDEDMAKITAILIVLVVFVAWLFIAPLSGALP